MEMLKEMVPLMGALMADLRGCWMERQWVAMMVFCSVHMRESLMARHWAVNLAMYWDY